MHHSKSCSPRGQQQQQQQQTGDGDKERDQRKKKKKKDKDQEKDKSSKSSSKSDKKDAPSFFAENDGLAAAAAAPPSTLPQPPPPTAPSTATQRAAENPHLVATLPKPQRDEGGGASDWHLCHDEHGNAYYYSETTGGQRVPLEELH